MMHKTILERFGGRCFSRDWKIGRRFFQSLEIALLAVACCTARAQEPIVDGTITQHFAAALRDLNMTESDPGFAKDHGEPRACIPWIRSALADPLLITRKADNLRLAAATATGDLWSVARDYLGITNIVMVSAAPEPASPLWSNLDGGLARALDLFLASARTADGLLQIAFHDLSQEERSLLAASIWVPLIHPEGNPEAWNRLVAAGIETQTIARVLAAQNVIDPEPAMTNYLALAARVDRGALMTASRIFQTAVARFATAAAGVQAWPTNSVVFDTDLGLVRLGAAGDESFNGPALLIANRNGRTAYRRDAGSANGLLGRRLAAIVDVGGDDLYESDALLAPGAAMFGVSVICDTRGDDTYRARLAGQASALFGVAWLEDRDGADSYRARFMGQAAAENGFALLLDRAGDDTYDIGLQGQGFAGFNGCGLLIDQAGSDRYSAGGVEPDAGRNDDRYLALAQGFSIGIRGFAGGGVGVLYDGGGNDTYSAEVYAQGVGYWYAVGMLLDERGNDSYSAYQYGQGAGIHLSLGLLADGGGNDRYTGYILCQGAGHDFGAGLLFDRSGDDTYVADHHSQGRALNTAFAVLCDSAGNDAYFARQNARAQGIGNTGDTRECGSLALLMDLGGDDQYSSGAMNDNELLRPLYGIVYDVSTNRPAGTGVRP